MAPHLAHLSSWMFSSSNEIQSRLSGGDLIGSYSSLIEGMMGRIVGLTTAQEIWDSLNQVYQTAFISTILNLKTQLMNTKKDGLTITEYLDRLKTIFDKPDRPSMDEIHNLLINHEYRLEEQHAVDKLNLVQAQGDRNYQPQQPHGGFNCGNTNHINQMFSLPCLAHPVTVPLVLLVRVCGFCIRELHITSLQTSVLSTTYCPSLVDDQVMVGNVFNTNHVNNVTKPDTKYGNNNPRFFKFDRNRDPLLSEARTLIGLQDRILNDFEWNRDPMPNKKHEPWYVRMPQSAMDGLIDKSYEHHEILR
ncbi:hypothetical protein TIFTF001_037367 [Ficus carica]|uniref:Uncharacterized protein n=1 Tax=Ficus carica TaxID=3494 RepID=A0AA88EGX7_FICCA|nr:hypothetical protein TIFTF001_037367 [Ficus carica]